MSRNISDDNLFVSFLAQSFSYSFSYSQFSGIILSSTNDYCDGFRSAGDEMPSWHRVGFFSLNDHETYIFLMINGDPHISYIFIYVCVYIYISRLFDKRCETMHNIARYAACLPSLFYDKFYSQKRGGGGGGRAYARVTRSFHISNFEVCNRSFKLPWP